MVMRKEVVEEALGTVAVVTSIALLALIIKQLRSHQKLVQSINQCATNDYLTLEVEGEITKDVNALLKAILKRKREFSRLLTMRGIVLVFDKDAMKILRNAFKDIEFFKILSQDKKIEYDIDEFVEKYEKYFGSFGEYRKTMNVEKILNWFSRRVDISALPDCAKLNLWWIGVVLRQLVKYGKEYGIEKVRFISKKVVAME
jgi:hypothetical protein